VDENIPLGFRGCQYMDYVLLAIPFPTSIRIVLVKSTIATLVRNDRMPCYPSTAIHMYSPWPDFWLGGFLH